MDERPSLRRTLVQIVIGILVGTQTVYGIGGLISGEISSNQTMQVFLIFLFPVIGTAIVNHALWRRYRPHRN
ncbi:hypothetical protein [Rhodococcus sp. PSBB049]|uniref:hypothetical protein n=1 Tax=Rhodococcus sp. PSBB049 TaxID=2812863 RepID=UPI00197DCF37|nr:hypothetical protein [Rhodococcus sp. PSBB049]QSE72532.1 hypothetical protein JYA91_29950 [Rhodococcus sp. PSBB049]